MQAIRAGIITVSDSCFAGLAVDETTAQLSSMLEVHDVEVVSAVLVPDDADRLCACMIELVDRDGVDLVLTTGGTGIGPRDVTPEATSSVIDRELPGLAELMRAESARATRYAWLSRAIVGTRGRSLIVNLPGSPRGAIECARLVLPLVPHAIDVMSGGDHRAAGARAAWSGDTPT